jgi:hypothetical protein
MSMTILALRKRRLQRKLRRPTRLVCPYHHALERADAGDDEPCELIGPGNEPAV